MAGFKKALKRTVDPGAQAMLRGRIAHTRYGKYSHARDQAYREGQGNITAAVHWATKQLEVHRHSPVLLHELATMQLMRAAVQPALAAAALELFQQAEDQAAAAWALGAGCARPLSDVLAALPTLAAKPSAVTTHHARAVYGRAATATGAAALDLQYTSDPAFVVELRNAGVAGPDGVVVVGAGSAGCALARSSASPYVSLPSNLQMPATWLPGMAQAPLEHQRWHDAARGRLPNHGALSPAQVKHLTRAASLVHFASTSFYHWLMEGVGRLLLLRSTLENDSRIKVLVPGLESKPFVRETLELLNLKLKAKQLVPYPAAPSPDVVVKAKYLYVADWPAVRHSAEPTHCLTPQPVLQQIRSAFVPNTPLPPAARTKVVFVSRRDVKMRQLADEDALVASLRTRLEALPAFELVVFKGSDHSLADALALFSQAAAIVGAHGGGLANMVAAQPGSLLLEFGFQSPNTRHYAHAAMVRAPEPSFAPFSLSHSPPPLPPSPPPKRLWTWNTNLCC